MFMLLSVHECPNSLIVVKNKLLHTGDKPPSPKSRKTRKKVSHLHSLKPKMAHVSI